MVYGTSYGPQIDVDNDLGPCNKPACKHNAHAGLASSTILKQQPEAFIGSLLGTAPQCPIKGYI